MLPTRLRAAGSMRARYSMAARPARISAPHPLARDDAVCPSRTPVALASPDSTECYRNQFARPLSAFLVGHRLLAGLACPDTAAVCAVLEKLTGIERKG
jgi:hypothetical protein